MKQFYADLFRDNEIPEINLDKVLQNCKVTKLTQAEANGLDGLLTMEELGKVLLTMKNNKTPGMDGFLVECFKVLWCYLIFFCSKSLKLMLQERSVAYLSMFSCYNLYSKRG